MKKLILLAAASLTMAGAALAHEGKDCCKGKDKKECSKEVAAKKEACKEGATAGGPSCCQKKGGDASAKKTGGAASEMAAHADVKTEKAETTQK
jgi:hypothetical protein